MQIRIKKKMYIPVNRFSAFYKQLIQFADSDGIFFSFTNIPITSESSYIPTAGSLNDQHLFREYYHPDHKIYKASQLVRLLHEIKNDKLDLSLVESKDRILNIDTIDIGCIYQKRKVISKLDELADLKRQSINVKLISYNNREYSRDEIDNRIHFYLDILKASKLGTEAAYQWCQSKDSTIISMPADILIGKTIIQRPPFLSYSQLCKRPFNQRKRKL